MKEKETSLGYIQLTRKCNNCCVMCSNPHVDDELTIGEIKSQIEKFVEKGANLIYFTGGEPTLNKNLPEAIKFCNSIGLECSIITNGIRLSDKNFCRELNKAGLKCVNFSLHSHEKEVYEKIAGKNNFNEMFKGLRNCYELICPPKINFVINSVNYNNLHKTVVFLGKNFPKINHFSINFVDYTGLARKNKWIIPKFADAEIGIYNLFRTLKKLGKTFRAERVPLCYMDGFEEFSTETIRSVLYQGYHALYLNKKPIGRKERSIIGQSRLDSRKQSDNACRACDLKEVCAGICSHYHELYGFSDIYPVFGKKKMESIIRRVNKL